MSNGIFFYGIMFLGDSLPNSEFKIIEGPHHIANKNPEEFNNEVENYLNKIIEK